MLDFYLGFYGDGLRARRSADPRRRRRGRPRPARSSSTTREPAGRRGARQGLCRGRTVVDMRRRPTLPPSQRATSRSTSTSRRSRAAARAARPSLAQTLAEHQHFLPRDSSTSDRAPTEHTPLTPLLRMSYKRAFRENLWAAVDRKEKGEWMRRNAASTRVRKERSELENHIIDQYIDGRISRGGTSCAAEPSSACRFRSSRSSQPPAAAARSRRDSGEPGTGAPADTGATEPHAPATR